MFDANIWLSINGPYPDKIEARGRAYSAFYKRALEAGAQIVVPQLIAGEFLNRAVKIQADVAGFDYRCKIHRADDYRDWIKEGCDLLNCVAGDHVKIADSFDSLELEPCFAAAEAGGLEFHDVLVVHMCRAGGHILVTDDADYAGQDLPIVTWNTRLT